MHSWPDNLGMLLAGTYTITSKTFLNAVQQDVSVETVSVGTCCTAAASFNSSKPFGCAADVDSGAKTVSVEVTDKNSCKGTDEIVLTIKDCVTAISSLALENSISVNPNPASNFIELKSEKYDNVNIEIYSTLGELVLSIEEFNTSNKIDITTINTGIYFMNITVNNDKLIKQFVKTK